jgi:acetoin utilization deacetylase AcuC-like enzyme
VAYFYDDTIGNFNYGPDHPMKPKRISMTHELIVSYGMYKHMDVYVNYRNKLKCLYIKFKIIYHILIIKK